ncbi:Dynein heavy chain 1, axonemal, partial [Frankliniella fusca]
YPWVAANVLDTCAAELLAPWVAFSVVWSVGATGDHATRERLSAWLRATMARHAHRPPFPAEGLVHDYRLHDGGFQDPTEDGEPAPPRWLHWMQGEEPFVIPKDIRYSDIEVPTLDMRRSEAMLDLLVTSGHNVACVGPTGTGKTLTVVAKLDRGLPNKFIADFLCFSARTSARQIQDVIDAKLDRRRKGVFGPPPNKRQVLFIDDFNMPALEVYGAQPPIELIRQWLDFQGWYDRKAVGEFRQIVDVNLVVAMGPPGGGRNPVTPRVMRHFHYLAFTELEEASKIAVFGTISRWWLSRTETLADEWERLVRASLDVYDVVLRELLPTPTKTHYTFNLRDLSKVFQGVLMANPKNVTALDQLLVLWYHENLRVYQDRLVNDKDRTWFSERLRAVLRTRFNQDPVGEDALYFCDLTNPEREYIRITDVDKLTRTLVESLDEFNAVSDVPRQLVLFTDAVQHVCRIARIMRQPQGNALLLGMGGSGRQSLTRLAAFALDLTCFQVVLSRTYGPVDWREDLKHVLLKAGLYMKETVFLFSDTQIKSESFLEDVNSVLSSGDVPNIYEAEELDKIYQLMRGVVTEQGLQATRSNMFSAYQRTVKSNLHCIITMRSFAKPTG